MAKPPKEVTEYMSKLGKRSLQTMTPEQRSERARKAGSAKGKTIKWKQPKGWLKLRTTKQRLFH